MWKITPFHSLGSSSAFDVYAWESSPLIFPTLVSRPPLTHFYDVNEFMCLTFRNLTAYDFVHRTMEFEFNNIELPILENLKMRHSKSKELRGVECILPKVYGKGERSRPNTIRQVLYSLSNRNFAAPDINQDHSVTDSANRLFRGFMNCLDVRKLLSFNEVVESDLNRIDKWLSTRDARKYKALLGCLNYNPWTENITNLKLMVKGELKPKTDCSGFGKYAPTANIVYYEHVINMFFSPIFLEIFSRISYSLRSNVVIYSGMNLDELANVIQSRLRFPLDSYHCCEIDFSKFDKSQGVIMKVYEEIVYKLFKFSPNVYDNFKISEYFVNARASCGVNVDLFAQRKTGSPNTFLSNSIVTLGLLSNYYNFDDFDLILVSGDDSLLLSRNPIANNTFLMNKDFGMEAKFLDHPTTYFCSKFLINDGKNIKILPDPVRFFEKLSVPVLASNLENTSLLRERFVSYRDLMKDFFSESNIVKIDMLMQIKYGIPYFSSYSALSNIHILLSSFKNFLKIFEGGDRCVI
ncbi:RNA-dependent RNA polymerase [Cordyline virus 2]|uniref:RNA-dependent RNA polymerase n=1 Tax=Cordyline virus 2 TaxID=1177751 RepID=L7P0B1_9CLOS|nr:RNA-dependent RNA polymerase [Cordyline virus 2]AFJ05046.1 RNA-dependent RNA polymerase [Cordyline virus 2]